MRLPSGKPTRKTDPDADMGWMCNGDEIMFIVGHPAGGAPFGYVTHLDGRYDEAAYQFLPRGT